jgi:1-phosphatidylinositol-3-phosphate 5-kinase
LVPRATANFFVSSKEALKDDSDEDGSSSGADDEMGPGDDDEAEAPKAATPQPIALKGANDLDAQKPFRFDLPSEGRPGALSASSTSSDVSLQASESTSNTDPIQHANAGASTDSGPSVPPSPQVSGTLSAVPRLSHLSESEMSSTGTETRSLMKTLSNLWNYRGADFIPLEYPK